MDRQIKLSKQKKAEKMTKAAENPNPPKQKIQPGQIEVAAHEEHQKVQQKPTLPPGQFLAQGKVQVN